MAAFAYAAPAIEQNFHAPDEFMAMVRTGYAPVLPGRGPVRDFEIIEGLPAQQVLTVDQSGAAYLAYYTMKQQPDGRWLIGGCILRRHSDQSA